jgi:hypothetical protein
MENEPISKSFVQILQFISLDISLQMSLDVSHSKKQITLFPFLPIFAENKIVD